MVITAQQDERRVGFEWVKKFGMKWAVLAALVVDLGKRGTRVPPDVKEQLTVAQVKIMSGCFSPCEIGCVLGKLEGQLVAIGSSVGDDYLRPWFDLLGQAMEGRMDPRRVSEIPALEVVAGECQWLASRCIEAGTAREKPLPQRGAEPR